MRSFGENSDFAELSFETLHSRRRDDADQVILRPSSSLETKERAATPYRLGWPCDGDTTGH